MVAAHLDLRTLVPSSCITAIHQFPVNMIFYLYNLNETKRFTRSKDDKVKEGMLTFKLRVAPRVNLATECMVLGSQPCTRKLSSLLLYSLSSLLFSSLQVQRVRNTGLVGWWCTSYVHYIRREFKVDGFCLIQQQITFIVFVVSLPLACLHAFFFFYLCGVYAELRRGKSWSL